MPSQPLPRVLSHVAVALVLLAFVWINARGLDQTPPVNEDESWIAAPGVEFFTSGQFASPLFAGYYGSERHYYDFMPVYSLIDGAAVRAFGMSLVTVRSVSLACATLTLWLTYLVGRRLFCAWHGLFAVVILGSWQIAATGIKPYLSLTTGIPLTDLARIGRYDVLVPVFGLGCVLAILRARDAPDRSAEWLALAGALAALATLTHYYGIVWLCAAAALVVALDPRRMRALIWPVLGFALTMAPWLWFISQDFATFVAQKQAQASRYGLDLGAMPGEWSRYGLIVTAALQGHMTTMLWIALVAAGLIRLLWMMQQRHRGAAVLAIVCAVVLLCFTFFVRRRLFNYLGTVWPLLALAASVALLAPWPGRVRRLGRVVATLVLLVAAAPGMTAYAQLAARAKTDSAYTDVCARIVKGLPSSARVLALQHWWLGVRPHVADYRSFIVPLTRMNPRETAHPISFAEAMALDPLEFILIDPEMADVLRAAGDPARPKAAPIAAEIAAFLGAHAAEVDAFDDPTYGRFTLYRVDPTSARIY